MGYLHNKIFFMHKILLSIGTNTHARFNLKRAKCVLQTYFPNIQFTDDTESKPYGDAYKQWFLNTLGYFESTLCKDELISFFKNIERSMGRSPEDKINGKVIIDIDLIKWNNEIITPEDFKRSYIRDLLPLVDDTTSVP